MTQGPSKSLEATTTGLTVHSILLLSRLALIHASQDLSLLVLDGLVDLGAARGLVAMHLGRKGGVVLAGDLLLGLLPAAAVLRVVLALGGREAVGYAALVLCVGAEHGQLDSCDHSVQVPDSFFNRWCCGVERVLLTGVVVLVGVLLPLLVGHGLVIVLLLGVS